MLAPPPRLNPRQARAFAELAHELVQLDDAETPVLPRVMEHLLPLFGADGSVAYRASPAQGGWKLDHCFVEGAGLAEAPELMASLLTRTPGRWSVFDPLRPEPEQRNRVIRTHQFVPPAVLAATPLARHVLAPMARERHDQLRVLVCDGPVLLSWFGVFRPWPFREEDEATLHALVEPLRRRLKLEQTALQSRLHRLGLQAALEAIPAPAFVCHADGRVDLANAAGELLLRHASSETRRRIGDALRTGNADALATVTTVSVRGLPRYSLVVLPSPDGGDRSTRAAQRWGLTRRQRDVLQLLVAGDTNKEIANKLRCSEGTVEFHVTALLRRAGVANRAALIAHFFASS